MMARRRRSGRPGVLARFVLGLPLDGRRYSNGTFWHRGSRRTGRPPYIVTWDWWTLAAGWQRSLLRLAVVGLALSVALMVLAVAR